MTGVPKFEPRGMVQALAEHDVSYVIIGGYACEVHGVAHSTIDLDIIIEDSERNAAALAEALESMNAIHARPPGSQQRIPPSVTRILTATGDLHYDTKFGRLDVSKESGGHTYKSLSTGATAVSSVHGTKVMVAALDTVADMKTKAGREKDKRALPAIHQRLRELESEGG